MSAAPMVGETIYESAVLPDPSCALDVFAFLLVPVEAFLAPGDDPGVRWAVLDVLHEAKRDVLLQWFAAAQSTGHVGGRG